MQNKELVAELLRSNMDSEAKSELIELVYVHRVDPIPSNRPRKKREAKKPATSPSGGGE